jgi:hypothetical protein
MLIDDKGWANVPNGEADHPDVRPTVIYINALLKGHE